MKCLHLFSDWKWTGPADPVVSLCENLARAGLDVQLAYRADPLDFPERTVGKEAKRRGVPICDKFRLNRYFSIRDWVHDIRTIREYVRNERIDILHTHLTHDHAEGAIALMGARYKSLLVRTDHKWNSLDDKFSMKTLLGRTDGLLAYGKTIIEKDIENFAYPRERTAILPPGVRIYSGSVENLKSSFAIAPDDIVIGVIGRLKPDRGFDTILKGFKLLTSRVDKVKLVIVGRSSQIEQSVLKPLSELGLEKDVILAGYRIDDYFSMISTFDIFVMMRAGSDGTARALREVLAMGKPAIVSDKGMLPELVRDGISGFVVADEEQLANQMERLVRDEHLRRAFGEQAKKIALEEWDYGNQAQQLIKYYESLLSLGRRS
jgi:glycosyltransferase involved in cell wall biosynthesis